MSMAGWRWGGCAEYWNEDRILFRLPGVYESRRTPARLWEWPAFLRGPSVFPPRQTTLRAICEEAGRLASTAEREIEGQRKIETRFHLGGFAHGRECPWPPGVPAAWGALARPMKSR